MRRSPRVKYCTWMAARTRVNGDRRKEKNTTTYQEINAAGRSTEDDSKVRYTAKTHTSETTNMKDQNYAATTTPEIRLAKRSPEYWRVTFDHPPLHIFGPEMLPQVNEIISAIETDERVKLVVFDSAVEAFFLIHLDFLAKLDDLAHLPPGPTGLHPWPEVLVRLSRAPVVSIALIRGRATGNGSEIALACDMRFASGEKASCRSSKSVLVWYLAADPWRDCRASSEGDALWKCFWARTTFEATWPSSTAM